MRAVRETWLHVDSTRYPDGPDSVEAAALLGSVFLRPQSVTHAELEAPAILSANWIYRPLGEIHSKSQDISVEEQIQAAANLIELENPKNACSEREFVGEDGENFCAEAVLLRTPAEAIAGMARTLAHLQGAHDGRAYDLMNQLANDPVSSDLRRKVARGAVLAPWRLIRDDPTYLFAWHARGDLVSHHQLAIYAIFCRSRICPMTAIVNLSERL
ncbi:hypothetical protein [Nannocystis pusilla]|uniref:hypothetical protein n=1 Tax=Nannocystis pusilla TaxID=889268 RepID=UPI003B80C098